MRLTNKTSTITVAVVAAVVALAIAAHASGALTFSTSHTAGHGTARSSVAAGQGGRGGKTGSGLSGGQAGPGSGGGSSSGAGGDGGSGKGGSGSGGSSSGGGVSGGSGSGGSTPGGSSSSGGSSSGGSSSGGSGPHLLIPAFPHTPHTVVTAIPSPSGTIGDPGVPCLQGYVWRQVVPDDYVCVTPAVRSQAAYDNSQANNRVALLSLWMSDWTPPSSPPQQNCSGGVCTTTSGGWDGPDFQINGDHFNFGPVLLQIRRNNGTVLWSQTVNATSYPGFPGAALYAQTQIGDCSGVPGTTDNDYAIAYDTVSHRWSNTVPIDSDCASF